MKKFKLFALAIMAMLSTNAMAVTDGTYLYSANGLDYSCVVSGTGTVFKATVVGLTTGNTTAASITIPATLKPVGTGADANIVNQNFDVVAIAANAFDKKATLKTVTIEGTKLATIGANAFSETGITAITLPATVSEIGASAFAKTGISALAIPAALAKIGANFISGTNITELDFTPAGATLAGTALTDIANGAFASEKLEKVIFYKKSGETVTENTKITKIVATWFASSFALKEVVFPTTLVEIEANAFQNTVLTTLDLSKSVAAVTLANMFNAKKTAPFTTLTSVSFPDLVGQTIPASAFAYCTGLTTLTFPTKWQEETAASQVAANAFQGCTGITGVTFKPLTATVWAGGKKPVFDVAAFADCTPTIKISTVAAYSDKYIAAPTNCEYGAYVNEGVEITLTSGFAMLKKTNAYMVDPADATVYQVYLDNVADGTIYMVPFKVVNGYYQVSATTAVIIKAKDKSAAKIKIYEDAGAANSWWAASLLARTDAVTAVSSLATGTEYVNVAAISGGQIGFTSPAGSTLPAKTYYVLSKKQYGAAGARIVWLDEDEATAILGAKKAVKEDGAIYNLAGQKVNASYKGVVIKNGKKYIQK